MAHGGATFLRYLLHESLPSDIKLHEASAPPCSRGDAMRDAASLRHNETTKILGRARLRKVKPSGVSTLEL